LFLEIHEEEFVFNSGSLLIKDQSFDARNLLQSEEKAAIPSC